MDVALFVPCYVDQFYPRVGLAAAEVLERHGVRVVFPEDQTCCGQPMANAGSLDAARPLAEKFLRVFGGHRYVVCPSGSCTSMVRNHYGPLLGERARELHGKVFELCEFLHDVLQVKARGRFEARVGLHQSCHGLRELRLGSGSERILPARDKVRELLGGI
ncbi:MAG TPA: (Fe-S)-binding protein, partial [Myxococcales bacterium]|nr:(Fe-S)-binding protein [Myxococcales bacterium]